MAKGPHVPNIRILRANDKGVNSKGDYVLVWMTAFRRPIRNFTLDRAFMHAAQLNKPVLIFEALRTKYRWASQRLHAFCLDGMQDTRKAFAKAQIRHYVYVEPKHGDGKGLLQALAKDACIIVADDYPAFFIPSMYEAVAPRLQLSLELVDSNGLLPMRATNTAHPSAYHFRRFLQKTLPDHLEHQPRASLLCDASFRDAPIASSILKKWPEASDEVLAGSDEVLASFKELDHQVKRCPIRGGFVAAQKRADDFFAEKFERYPDDRNQPDLMATTNLSPYLHWGHISTHGIFARIVNKEGWQPGHVSKNATGARAGWWGMSPAAEALLDELITWRELSYNTCAFDKSYADPKNLPQWAKQTLKDHEADPREHRYGLKDLESANTHDDVWNAAQRELMQHGTLHNYMRMLWGKRILAWSKNAKEALDVLEHLNNKYGVDGRDPNSYAGIFWCLGRYDRPWPEHDVFGKVRMMTSASTKRKLKIKDYLKKWGGENQGQLRLES